MASKGKSEASRTSWVPAVAVLAACSLFGYAVLPYFSERLAPPSALTGIEAPDFTLPVFHGGDNGARIHLQSLRGQVVLLDFWASWCGPCVAQARILSEVARRHADEPVQLVGINTDDAPERARRFAADHELPYPSVHDTGAVAQTYGVPGLPTIVVIDPRGRITEVFSRVVGIEAIEAAIEAAGAADVTPAR